MGSFKAFCKKLRPSEKANTGYHIRSVFNQFLRISQTVVARFEWKATKCKFFSKLDMLKISVKLQKMYSLSVILVINTAIKRMSSKN